MRDILTALEADEEIGNFGEEEVVIIEKIAEVLERRKKDKLPVLTGIPKRKLLRLIKFCSTLKHIALQRLMNYFMQEMWLLQIGWEQRLIRQQRERNQCGGEGYKIRPILIPLSLILRKAKAAHEFSGSKEKINHLLFMNDLKLYSHNEKELDLLDQTICIFSKDIGMEFGIEKCAMLVIEKGKIVKSVGIELLDGKVIKSLQEGESYKYLGIHNGNDNSQNMMLNNQ